MTLDFLTHFKTTPFTEFFLSMQASPAAEAAPALQKDPGGFLQHYMNVIIEKSVFFVPKILIALIILWIGLTIAGRLYRKLVSRAQASENVDTTLGNFAATAVKYAVIIATFLAAIAVVGVPVAKVFVILSAATLAIGLALQGSMSNVAAGLLLVMFRPYKIGDYVEVAGEEGVVEDLNIFTTTLITLDNVKVILSNSEVRGNTIKNFTSQPVRRVDVDFGIDYDDDMDKAIKIITQTAAKDSRVLTEPDAPWAKVSCLNDSSVDIQMRVWCKPDDYWDVRFDLIKAVKEAFDKGGISIPYPHVVEIEK
jgi:small conductance mechanosensitive channel